MPSIEINSISDDNASSGRHETGEALMQELLTKITGFIFNAEEYVVFSFYKDPHLFRTCDLTVADFIAPVHKLYFNIAYSIVCEEGLDLLNEKSIYDYLGTHTELLSCFEEYGGYKAIKRKISQINVGNYSAYIDEMRKWRSVVKLYKYGFILTEEKLSHYADLSYDELYDEYINEIEGVFGEESTQNQKFLLTENIMELIEDLNKGKALGLPYYKMPEMNKLIGGQHLGTITLLGGVSNAGKSTVARTMTVPSIIESKEKLAIIVNEDSYKTWQREMLVWVCNNVLKFDLQKQTVRDGHFKQEVREKLMEAAIWLENKNQSKSIVLLPMDRYSTSKAINLIRKYARIGYKYFIIDTFKLDADSRLVNTPLEMQQAMVDIKDAIKPEALNVHVLATFQLEKSSATKRFYTQSNIGISKNIVDVASTCIMIRDVYSDELKKGKKELRVYTTDHNGEKKSVVLDPSKSYQVFFIVKNQEGEANGRQIVVEHDKSRNVMREVGFAEIMPDAKR